MEKLWVETSLAPEILIQEIHGSLTLKGVNEAQVLIKAEHDQVELEYDDDRVVIRGHESCRVYVPSGATVQIGAIHGAGEIKLLEDKLSIGEVHGPLTLRYVGQTTVGKVHGHLAARNINGDLTVSNIEGHAEVRTVDGDLVLAQVAGNLEVRNAEQDISARANGSVQLRLSAAGGLQYQVEAGGNLNCRLPGDANLALELASGGEQIRLQLPGQARTLHAESFETTLGQGGAPMRLSAGGNLSVSVQAGETPELRFDTEWTADLQGLDDFGQQLSSQIEKQVAAQMEAVARQVEEQMARLGVSLNAAGFSEEEQQRIIGQAQRASERANRRAQERIHRSQERLQRKLEAARRRDELKQAAARRSSSVRQEWNPPQPVEESSVEQERLLILRMLEQKK
ncbi:MAG TPA: hypothetical protein VLS48_01935, partial [Anaerolineales bacterium]|nr:hypothetical protein [Anaerolineales bacterium]